MKKLLIVVDYQKDFVNGSLGFKEAEYLDEYLASLIDQYHQNKDDVIFTFDTHQNNYLETQEGKNLPIEHCIKIDRISPFPSLLLFTSVPFI